MTQNEAHEILLVEDSAPYAHLAMHAFSKSSFKSNVSHAKDGVEALAMLRREGSYAECPRPELVFLDLNMPRKDGRQVLRELKSDAELGDIPVVVLTTSASENDIAETYRLGSNSYIVKPVELKEFLTVMEQTQHYWFRICSLPSAR
ncbi:MAG: response regulator [Fuerstiella sp.]